MVILIETTPMTLSFSRSFATASLSNVFSYSGAAVDKISPNIARLAVPLR